MKIINLPAIYLLKFYRACISPLLPRACRFEPTCSVYAMGCFQRFGFFKALYLTVRRVLRCHPFCEGGMDPVPEIDERTKSRAHERTIL